MNDLLQKAEKRLETKSVLKIIEAVDQVAATFLDPESRFRHKAVSQLASGMTPEMAHFVLDDLFRQLTRPALLQLLEEELGNPLILDRFQPRRNKTGFTRAYGHGRITHILPGNIPGIAVMSLAFALLTKSASVAKISTKSLPDGFPSLAPIFLQALQQTDPDLSESILLVQDNKQLDESLHWANLVILYGSDQTIEALRPHIPSKTKTILYGPKFSIGIVANEKIAPDVAEAAARDIALYNQQGCLSPHIFYVEEPTIETNPITDTHASKIFAKWVGEALDKMPSPQVLPSPATASTIQQLRGTIPIKGGAVFKSTEGVRWTVLYDPTPDVIRSPLSRTIFIKPIQNILDIVPALERFRSSLQCIGVAIPPKRTPLLLDRIGSLGVCRICPIGKMQSPPLTWHHDGRFRILDMLRFVDWEESCPSVKIF